jgi:hypothetical protein
MTNIHGKAYAMTVITAMPPWKTWIVRAFFWILGTFKSLQSNLLNLSFIHFARWVVITRNQFPRLTSEQPQEVLRYDYLLFCSNFNGTWNQYIDAFSAVLSGGLNGIWRWSQKYPGAVPVTNFKRMISLSQFDTDYYYTAYPYATTNDVKAAHRVGSALNTFANTSKDLPPEEFARAYLRLMVQVQGDLGATGPGPEGA